MLLAGDGGGAVFFVIHNLFLAVEGKAILHIALDAVDGEGFAGLDDRPEHASERASGISLVDDLGDGFGTGNGADSEERPDAEQEKEQHHDRYQRGDAKALDSKVGDNDEDEHSGADSGKGGGGDGPAWGQHSGIQQVAGEKQNDGGEASGKDGVNNEEPGLEALMAFAVDVVAGEDGQRGDGREDVAGEFRFGEGEEDDGEESPEDEELGKASPAR